MQSASNTELLSARATLERAVRAAGAIQLEGVPSLRVEAKGEGDIVTSVDRACEAAVVELIRGAHPAHAVLSEESADGTEAGPSSRAAEGPVWILDPLDGTKNYVHGLPRFGCALALRWGGDTLLGAVYDPTHEELFFAERDRGATLNGKPIRVSSTGGLDQALVASALTVRRRFAAHHFERLRMLAQSTQGVRVGGCAALDLCDVARGRLDAYLEEGLDPWDTAAGALIVREAGGAVTDFRGAAHDPFGAETLASNGMIGAALVERLRASEGAQ